MDAISEIESLKLHDSGLNEIYVDFIKGEIQLFIVREIEEGVMKLNFGEVANLSFAAIEIWEDIEIFQVDVVEAGKEIYYVKFIILLGSGLPSWEFSFEFKQFSISPVSRKNK